MEISSPLLALPTELLLQIIDYVSANDLDAFTSTCERLRATAAERLATHRKLKKEYGNVQLGSNDNINYRNPISFLHAALKDPGLATYPLTLTLAEYKPDLWPNHTEQNTLNDAILQETDGFQACLLAFPFIPAKDLQKWHTAIMSHDASPIYAFLLTTLPNIQKLTYDGVVLNTRYIDHILRSLASASSTSGINNSKLLDKLSNVQVRDLPRKGSYGDRELRPPTSALFTHVPSLRSLSLIMNNRIWPTFLLSHLAVSGIQHLELSRYHISTSELTSNLASMPSLRSFIHEGPDASGELVEVLEGCCGSTLEKLELRYHFSVGVAPITSLHAFVALKEIMVFENAFISGDIDEIGKLVDILPPAIEPISLLTNDWRVGIGVLDGIATRGGTKLPILRNMNVGWSCGEISAFWGRWSVRRIRKRCWRGLRRGRVLRLRGLLLSGARWNIGIRGG